MSNARESASGDAERFSAGAPRRIRRWLLALALVAGVPLVWFQGWQFGVGYGLGAVVAAAAMHELELVAAALSARAAGEGEGRVDEDAPESSAHTGLRFLLRYAAAAVVGYVIFTISRAALYGYIAGLFLPVGAMVCEAGYEAWVALRRGI